MGTGYNVGMMPGKAGKHSGNSGNTARLDRYPAHNNDTRTGYLLCLPGNQPNYYEMMNAPGSTTTLIAAGILLAASLPASADETATLLCNFKHGQIEIVINYTKGTANGATAIISDKEIIWSPEKNTKGMAVINRYTGIMQLSKGRKEFYGSCNKKPE